MYTAIKSALAWTIYLIALPLTLTANFLLFITFIIFAFIYNDTYDGFMDCIEKNIHRFKYSLLWIKYR